MSFVKQTLLKQTFLIFCLFAGNAWGQSEWLERKVSLQVENISPESARQEAQEKALMQMTEELGKEFLGEERFTKNRNLVMGRILKNSAKFIPFVKTAIQESTNNLHSIQVDLKISRGSFRQLLQEQGLLSQGGAQPVVIPYISWVDRGRSKSYRWWKERSDFSTDPLPRFERFLEAVLKNNFVRSGFYVWQPVEGTLWNHLPTLYQSERLTSEDYQSLGLFYQAPLAIDGMVAIVPSKDRADRFQIEIKWTAFLTENGKNVGDVARQFLTEAGPQDRVVEKKLKEILDGAASDLVGQIFEAWQKGTLSSRTLKLTFLNPPSLKSQEILKEKLREEFSMIKAIRERSLSREQVVFEIETPMTVQELLKKMDKFEFESRKYKAEVEGETEISFQVLN